MVVKPAVWVTIMTSVALGTVAGLTVQAKESSSKNDKLVANPHPSSRNAEKEESLPSASGQGPRIVYSISLKRVWIVGAQSQINSTFQAHRGSISPAPGTYKVQSRKRRGVGDGGADLNSVLYFTKVHDQWAALSAQKGFKSSGSAPAHPGAGIRLPESAGRILWESGGLGVKVVVVD